MGAGSRLIRNKAAPSPITVPSRFLLKGLQRVLLMDPVRTIKYITQGFYARLNPHYRRNDEFGRCSICGNYSRFRYGTIVTAGSEVAVSCGWDEHFTKEINITNTLKCSYCAAKFRVRCAAESLLRYFWKGNIRSVAELVNRLREGKVNASWQALETTANDGIFSGFGNVKNVVMSEYFDDVERGRYRDGIRSEDLQAMTFADNSFDVVIALDVFEHIADPLKAFAELRRVIKPSGIGLITVPLDTRVKKTRTIAKMENGKIAYLGKRSHHCDPLREEGSPVFTEFGTDIGDNLKSLGYDVLCDIYRTKRTKVPQSVLLLIKK